MLASLAVFPASAKNETEVKTGVGMSIMGFSAYEVISESTFTSDVLEDATVTVINYWATWCGPCVSEMPHLRTLYEHYLETPEADAQLIGAISIGNGCTQQTATSFLKNNGYNWPNLIPDSILNAVFHTEPYIPQTLIVDHHGIVRQHIIGSVPSAQYLQNIVDNWVNTVLEEDAAVVAVPGDFDGDGEVTVQDALGVLRVAMQLVDAPDGADLDANGDGSVDMQDALYVLRFAMGLVTD